MAQIKRGACRRKARAGSRASGVLTIAANVAQSCTRQGKNPEVGQIEREDPDMLRTVNNLAHILSTRFRKYAKAQQLLEAVLEAHRRVLEAPRPERLAPRVHWRVSVTEARHSHSGLGFHPGGPRMQISPDKLVSDAAGDRAVADCVVSIPPTRAATRLAERCGRCPPALAAGTAARRRVVTKPEHNRKRARRAVFRHTAAGCYVVPDDGKELSLKPECVARAGCAVAGCESEEDE